MSTSSLFKGPVSKAMSRWSNPLPFRQTTTSQGDGSQSTVKQMQISKPISRSSTTLLPAGGYDLASTTSPEDTSLPSQPRTINVVLFGETGVGKSSVINLIAQKEVAKVSSDVNGCTMQSTRYDIPFDDMNFSIFDTIGLEEPQMGVNGYLKAIEKAYELIVKLGAAGGIHLLLFCMRGGRITATTQSNYRLFCECLCNTKVPIALVFTGLERELEMEDWWTRNKTHIEHYGIKSDGHACITAVQDETPEESFKYMQSQKRIRELLKTCALKNEAFLLEPHSWFAKLGKGMRSFIEKHRNPKRRDVMRVLTNRCKLDPETARKIAEMMEKSDPETKEEGQDEHAVNKEEPNPAVGTGEVAKDPGELDVPKQPGDVKAVSRNPDVRPDKREAPEKDAVELDAQSQQRGDIKSVPRDRGDASDGHEKREVMRKVGDLDAPSKRHGDMRASPRNRVDALEGNDRREAKRDVGKLDTPSKQPGDIKTALRDREYPPEKDKKDVVKKDVGGPDPLLKQYGDTKAEFLTRTDVLDGWRTKTNENGGGYTRARQRQEDWQVIGPGLD